ncbi:hypothetical protein LSAT2_013748 [Lamellibrachia satsuma]|nr:hypothetical protein LSAT2_013748 [Lamellibrachia satsuma]
MNGLALCINYQVRRRDNAGDAATRARPRVGSGRSRRNPARRPTQTSRYRCASELDSLQSESVVETMCVKPQVIRGRLRSTVSNQESMLPCSGYVSNFMTVVRNGSRSCCSNSNLLL